MDQIQLKASQRNTLGKQVKALRKKGLVPAHVFGHGIESAAVQCDVEELKKVIASAGRTRLINLTLDKQEPKNVMVREVQRHPITRELIHVDLYQVNMAEKIHVAVPIVIVGEAPALKNKAFLLSQDLNKLEIECLPDRIPNTIEVDVSGLAELGNNIRVRDLKTGEGITVKNNPDVLIVKISERPVEEVVEKAPIAAAEGAAATAEGAAAPAAEGAAVPAAEKKAPPAAEKK